jgi:hypothetical protein
MAELAVGLGAAVGTNVAPEEDVADAEAPAAADWLGGEAEPPVPVTCWPLPPDDPPLGVLVGVGGAVNVGATVGVGDVGGGVVVGVGVLGTGVGVGGGHSGGGLGW